MYQSPHMRRLRNDLAALERLRSESSVFRFSAQGDPPQIYLIVFKGKGLWRDRNKVKISETHRVEIKLGSSYPRTMPEIRWMTPVYHPNISEIGMVCLGGYGTHWVPSVQLDDLCNMLWDMARYHNYDIRSPYNRDSALWVASQTTFLFPIDTRPLRDLRAALGRIASAPSNAEKTDSLSQVGANGASRSPARPPETDSQTEVARVRQFIEALDRRDHRRTDRPTQVARVRQFISGRIFSKSRVPEPNHLAANIGEVRPDEEVRAPSFADPSRDGEPADMVLLDERGIAVQPEPEAPSPESDEIVFIE
jgi:ubiquitin-protein ligase